MYCERFQSTPPSREATLYLSRISAKIAVSIHAPLTGGDDRHERYFVGGMVSIHAPLTGGDRNILWLKIAPTLDVVLYLPLIGIQFNMRYSLRSHM